MAVVGGNHIHHIVTGECGGSVKADQVHRAQLWGDVEGHAWAVVYKAIGSVRCLTAADIRGSAVATVAKSVQKGEFTEKAAIGCGRKRLVGARVETHPAVSTNFLLTRTERRLRSSLCTQCVMPYPAFLT